MIRQPLFARMGLAARMILAIFLVSSIVTAVGFYLQSEILRQSFEQKEIDRANSPRVLIKSEIAYEIERVEALARILRLNDALISAVADDSPTRAVERLQQILAPVFPVLNVNALAVVNQKMETSYSAGNFSQPDGIQKIWGIEEALIGRESMVTAAGASGLEIYVVVPLGSDPKSLSALVLGIVVDKSFLKRISSETGSRISMVDINGRMLATYADDRVPVLVDAAQVLASLRLKVELHQARSELGLTTIYFADAVLDQTLVWVVTVDSREANEALRQEQMKALLLSMAAGLGGALVLGFLARRHAQSILDIKRKAEQSVHQMTGLAAPGQTAGARSMSEIESLASCLGVMTASWTTHARELALARASLALTNAGLEQQVQTRTTNVLEGELRYRILVEQSTDLIILCDAQRSILYANPAVLRAIQCGNLQDLVGCAVETLFEEQEQAQFMTSFAALLESSGHINLENHRLVVRGGAAINVDVNATSYFDGARLRVQLILHDVTRQRTYEMTLRDQLSFIDQLVEAIPLPISVRDERGKFLRVNQAYEMLYHCTRAQVISQSIFDVLPYELACLVSENDHAAANSPQPISYDNPVAFNGKAPRHLLAQVCAVRRSDGSLIGVITVEADLTQLHQKETELRDANTQLGQLSQHLIHAQEDERRRIARDLHDQVGQILTALKISLRTLAKRAVVSPENLAQPVLLVDEVLNHTRNLTSSLHPHILENLGLEAAVRSLLERYVKPGGQNFSLSILVALGRSTPANELVAYRIIQESITNAMRHANAQNLQIVFDMKGDAACITVTDDGTGFDSSSTQLNRRRPPALGLASMRERVEEVGGSLGIHSQLGKGCEVNILLPWANLANS